MRFNHVENLNNSGLNGIVSVAHARRTLAWQLINELAGGRVSSSDQSEEPRTKDTSSTVFYGSFEGPI